MSRRPRRIVRGHSPASPHVRLPAWSAAERNHGTAMPAPRIALIHATPVSIEPSRAAFAELWPEARTTNLLDDSLSADLAVAGRLDDRMVERFRELARYVARD